MRSITRLGFGVLGLAWLACSQGTPGEGGTGGGMGGTTGGGGGGSSAGTGLVFEMPDCVRALVASCPASGPCVSEPGPNGAWAPAAICFSSGLSAMFESQFSGSTSGNKVAHVRKADGTPCYSFQTTLIGGEVLRYVWIDPSGQVVATGSFVPTQVTCESGGQMSTCNDAAGNPSTSCCPLDDLGTSSTCPGFSCSAGSCQ